MRSAIGTSSPAFGMPIPDVDKARTEMVAKRSMAAGFVRIDGLLYYPDTTLMLLGDAKTFVELQRNTLLLLPFEAAKCVPSQPIVEMEIQDNLLFPRAIEMESNRFRGRHVEIRDQRTSACVFHHKEL